MRITVILKVFFQKDKRILENYGSFPAANRVYLAFIIIIIIIIIIILNLVSCNM